MIMVVIIKNYLSVTLCLHNKNIFMAAKKKAAKKSSKKRSAKKAHKKTAKRKSAKRA
jgi:hypothetical protein